MHSRNGERDVGRAKHRGQRKGWRANVEPWLLIDAQRIRRCKNVSLYIMSVKRIDDAEVKIIHIITRRHFK